MAVTPCRPHAVFSSARQAWDQRPAGPLRWLDILANSFAVVSLVARSLCALDRQSMSSIMAGYAVHLVCRRDLDASSVLPSWWCGAFYLGSKAAARRPKRVCAWSPLSTALACCADDVASIICRDVRVAALRSCEGLQITPRHRCRGPRRNLPKTNSNCRIPPAGRAIDVRRFASLLITPARALDECL